MKKSFLFLVLLTLYCEENPFRSNSISQDNSRIIYGHVDVQNSADNSGVFVWLEKLNLFSWTDKNGDFLLKIPAKSESIPGGGLTQYLTLYYYIANYNVEKSQVYIFDGAFKYKEADLDKDGHIVNPILLKKLVNVTVSVMPEKVDFTQRNVIELETVVNGTGIAPVTVAAYLAWTYDLTAFLIRNVSNPEQKVKNILGGYLQNTIIGTRVWHNSISLSKLNLPPGTYEILPYMSIQQDIPEELITTIAKYANDFNDDHFKIPMRYTPAIFEILE